MNCEHVAYLHFILWHHAQLWLELLASSLMDSNQGYHICPRTFFRDSIALLLESICFLEISCFLQLCNQAYVSQFWCIGFFLLLVIVAPHALNVAVYVQVCRLFCVLYMALFGLVQAKMKVFSVPLFNLLQQSLYVTYFIVFPIWRMKHSFSPWHGLKGVLNFFFDFLHFLCSTLKL